MNLKSWKYYRTLRFICCVPVVVIVSIIIGPALMAAMMFEFLVTEE